MPFILPFPVTRPTYTWPPVKSPVRKVSPPPTKNPTISVTNPAGKSAQVGRSGVGSNPSYSALSAVFQFTDTRSAGNVNDYPLSSDGAWTALEINTSVTVTSGSTAVPATDILTAYSRIEILDSSGTIISMQPAPDFYNFAQRFGELHVRPATVQVTGVASGNATASGSYMIYGVNLPQNRGPYTFRISIVPAATFSADATALSVTTTLSLQAGDPASVVSQSRYMFSNLPFTPGANGVNDLAPLAPIQGVSLSELFITGQTSDTADISFIQMQSVGANVGSRILPSDLVALANSEMVSSLPTDTTYLLFPLKTNITLGRDSHLYLNWGASPSSTIRTGFYWLQ